MLWNRLLILVLICCVTVREDFSFLLTPSVHASPSDAQTHFPPDETSFEDGEDATTWDEEPESNEQDTSLPDEMPPEDGAIPVVLEDDPEPEKERVYCSGEHNTLCLFVIRAFVSETDVPSFACFNSFCTLRKLRT